MQLEKLTRAEREEIQKLAEEIRQQVEKQIQPQTEEIRKLADQIREKVHEQIRPATEKTQGTRQAASGADEFREVDQEAVKKLQEEIERSTKRRFAAPRRKFGRSKKRSAPTK